MRTEIQITDRNLPEIVNDVIEALRVNNNPFTVFTHNGRLSRVIPTGKGTVEVASLTVDSLNNLAYKAADFYRVNAKGEFSAAFIPIQVSRDILFGGERHDAFPTLVEVTETPLVAPGGIVECRPGYMSGTKMFFAPFEGNEFKIERISPTKANVQQAKKEIFGYLFDGFPFDGRASKANTLALALQPIVRHLIEGATPLFVIDAPTRGTGKTLLALTAASFASPMRIATKATPKDDAEFQKIITASLRAGNQHIFFDNVKTHVDSASLCTALTTTNWEGRILHQSSNVTIPNMSTFIMSGNNISLDEELTSRSVYIRLDSRRERPEMRSGFKCPNPVEEVRVRRSHYLGLLLCLVEHWIAKGMPPYAGTAVSRYRAWLSVMGGLLDSVGVYGLIENYDQRTLATNPTHLAWTAFVAKWGDAHGTNAVTVREGLVEFAFGTLNAYGQVDKEGPLLDVLRCAVTNRPNRLGKALDERVDRVFGEWRIVRGELRDGNTTYRLERA